MAALKDANVLPHMDLTNASIGPDESDTGWNVFTDFVKTLPTSFQIEGAYTEADLTDFMEKLLDIEERLNAWSCGEIEIEDDTPSVGYATLKYYTDDATPTLYKTIVVNKTTGARSQAT
jgi:hypothetical protein